MADPDQATRGSRASQIPRLTRMILNPRRRHPYPPVRTSEAPANADQQSRCLLQSPEPSRENTPVAAKIKRDEDQGIGNELSDEEFLSGCNLSLPDTDDEGL